MQPDEIKLTDWKRILFGNVPAEFYLELIIRGLLIYLLLMLAMRLLGKRMAGQISRLELAALVSLASAIGVPMLSPSNGLLPALVIIIIIVAFSRAIAGISTNKQNFEKLTQGDLDILVEDCVLCLDTMLRVRITRERLFAHLRSEKIHHLGAVKRIYMEANGTFTMVSNKPVVPGLLILPDWDKEFIEEQLTKTDVTVCKECGGKQPEVKIRDEDLKCPNCKATEWTKAYFEK